MKVYEAKKFTKEINYKDRNSIRSGCCLSDENPESLGKFDTLEAALKKISTFIPSCTKYNTAIPFYVVEEYAVEIYEADEDGEFISGSDFEMFHEHYEWDMETNDIIFTNSNWR